MTEFGLSYLQAITDYDLDAKFVVAENLRKEMCRHAAEIEERIDRTILPRLPMEMKTDQP